MRNCLSQSIFTVWRHGALCIWHTVDKFGHRNETIIGISCCCQFSFDWLNFRLELHFVLDVFMKRYALNTDSQCPKQLTDYYQCTATNDDDDNYYYYEQKSFWICKHFYRMKMHLVSRSSSSFRCINWSKWIRRIPSWRGKKWTEIK